MPMAEIRIRTDGDKKQFKEGRVTLRTEAPPGTRDYVWNLNGQQIPDAINNQYEFDLSKETAGEYTVAAKLEGMPMTSAPIRISIEEPAAAPAPGGSGGGTTPPEDPPTFHPGFARSSAIAIGLTATALGVILLFLLSKIFVDAFWKDLEDRLQIAVVLGLPSAILGAAILLLGAWMAAVEWRGRFKELPAKEPDKPVTKGGPTPSDVKEIIAAVGNLRGAALAMVIGGILMLGTAWIAQSAAGAPGPAEATPTTAPAAPEPT